MIHWCWDGTNSLSDVTAVIKGGGTQKEWPLGKWGEKSAFWSCPSGLAQKIAFWPLLQSAEDFYQAPGGDTDLSAAIGLCW